jgi:hypothetical protein
MVEALLTLSPHAHAALKQRCFKGKRPMHSVPSSNKGVLSLITNAMHKHTGSSSSKHVAKASIKSHATAVVKASNGARTVAQHSAVKPLSQRVAGTTSQSGSVTSLTSSDYRVLL